MIEFLESVTCKSDLIVNARVCLCNAHLMVIWLKNAQQPYCNYPFTMRSCFQFANFKRDRICNYRTSQKEPPVQNLSNGKP